ncbi:TetR/AcrR family transcriptional regulator [Polyangium sp. y55x31]|uniref:TetR/AcrR family transcriptional regulator n=1 Tax=Polyangium sp. y55x31 TaxID=3042688 RepID=UPI00248319B0|nr:TetR/AcrR family transcriptional regulator [Polyangium sp. y55x31]MDI1476021.1 TetR/AcrR family transcriptional regulator [Polyangium sp. y55x31]
MSSSSERRTALPRRRDEAKALFRNAILDAAEHVFAQQGFHGARIQDIADHARIAVGTVYNHFEQKEDVLHALLEVRLEEMIGNLRPQPTDPEPFEQKLRCCILRTLRFAEEHRDFHQVALDCGLFAKGTASASNILKEKAVAHFEKLRATTLALVNEGLKCGALRPMDPVPLARMLGGLIRSSSIGMLMEQSHPDLEAEASLLVDLYLNGAGRADRPGRPRDESDLGER